MESHSKTTSTKKNFLYMFVAQTVSLFLSFLVSLVIPKILSIEDYGYWQLFIFYSGYVGFFHLGYCDGIYLLFGGKRFEEIDIKDLKKQFFAFSLMELFFSILFGGIGFFVENGNSNRQIVLLFTAAFIILNNLTDYFSLLFQALNRIKEFSYSLLLSKVCFLVSLFILIGLKVESYIPYIVLYSCSFLISLFFLFYQSNFWKGGYEKISKDTFRELFSYIKVGVSLMIAVISSSLILGLCKYIIDSTWGVEAFAKFSFSVSLTTAIITFSSQMALVLFPALRQTDPDSLKKIYSLMRSVLTLFLPIAFILFFPGRIILNWWLPKYSESVEYLPLLLPMCTFDGVMQVVCSTFFKVLRKEKKLLLFNLIGLALAAILDSVFAFAFKDIILVILSSTISIFARSAISDLYLGKLMGQKNWWPICLETCLAISFVALTWYLDKIIAFSIFLCIYALFLLLRKQELKTVFSYIQTKIRTTRLKRKSKVPCTPREGFKGQTVNNQPAQYLGNGLIFCEPRTEISFFESLSKGKFSNLKKRISIKGTIINDPSTSGMIFLRIVTNYSRCKFYFFFLISKGEIESAKEKAKEKVRFFFECLANNSVPSNSSEMMPFFLCVNANKQDLEVLNKMNISPSSKINYYTLLFVLTDPVRNSQKVYSSISFSFFLKKNKKWLLVHQLLSFLYGIFICFSICSLSADVTKNIVISFFCSTILSFVLFEYRATQQECFVGFRQKIIYSCFVSMLSTPSFFFGVLVFLCLIKAGYFLSRASINVWTIPSALLASLAFFIISLAFPFVFSILKHRSALRE